ncbi:MAG: hypothetical protein K6F18_05470 [Lactobacillus sp.]|nr:hypothetical protein [Lactobacillus sp.]
MHKKLFVILLVLTFSLILTIGNANAKQRSLRRINQQLTDNLEEHQEYADSDPGNYDYAKYIQKIYYRDHKTIIIQVKAGFQKMTKNDKTSISNQAIALTRSVQSNNDKRPVTIKVKRNKKVIGLKKPNQKNYQWK